MNFIPYEKYQIETHLNTYKGKEKIMTIVDPPEKLTGKTKPFEGKMMGNVFRISRNIDGMKLFLPVVQGEVFDDLIKVTVRYNLKVIFQMIFGIFAVLYIGFTMLHRKFYLGTAVSFSMIILMYGMAITQFKWEAKTARTILERLFSQK